MAGIPGIDPTPLYQKKWFIESLGAIPPIVAVVTTSIVAFNDADPAKHWPAWVGVGVIAWLIGASVLKVLQARRQDQKEDIAQDHDGLKAALMVVHAAISSGAGFSRSDKENGRLRMTMHRVVPNGQELEQLVPYIGGAGGKTGRRFSIQSGIIGKAVREVKPFVGARKNDDYPSYIAELVSDWAYTEDDARALSIDRMSWLAVPIFYKNKKAEAVVYLDSNQRDLFDRTMINLVTYTCAGIASYCEERYK